MTQDCCRAGGGYLRIGVISGQSAATSIRSSSPLKIMVPRPRGHSVWACLSSFGGGLVPGDEISVQVDLGERARCYLSTQASTKVYRNPESRPCSHNLQARLARGSFLAVIPDPIQAFLGSCYSQRQEFSLAPESGLVLVDWLCSGRAARGERWAFRRFQSRNEISLDGSRVLVDSLMLDPEDGPLTDFYRLGRFNCLAVVLVIGESLHSAGTQLLEEFAQLPVSQRGSVVSSACSVRQGALIRIAGEQPQVVAAQILRHLAFVTGILGEAPWLRKF